jgi:hypothetical protein
MQSVLYSTIKLQVLNHFEQSTVLSIITALLIPYAYPLSKNGMSPHTLASSCLCMDVCKQNISCLQAII